MIHKLKQVETLGRTDKLSADEQKEITFVFVTPRSWGREERDKWIKDKKAVSHWKDILVHDGNDLEHWLDIAPDVDIWFSRLIGHAVEGVQDLGSHWDALRLIADPSLIPLVFITSREQEVAAVGKWLAEPASSLFMRTSGLSDGLDFLAALSSRVDLPKLHNSLIVHTAEAWRNLAARREQLIMIAAPTLALQASDIAGAVENGHYVFLSGPHANSPSGPVENPSTSGSLFH